MIKLYYPKKRRIGKMAYTIKSNCIECGKCEKECPKDAIYQTCGQYAIIPRRCIECGKCAKVCPVGAPEPKKKLF